MSWRPPPPEADMVGWVIDQGLSGTNLATFLEDLGGRLLALGIPVYRLFLAMPMISPELKAVGYIWRQGQPTQRDEVGHDSDGREFEDSPFATMLAAGETMRRWTTGDLHGTGYPVIDLIASEGGTDHLAYIVGFDPTDSAALRGAALSFTSDTPSGFSDFDVDRLSRLVQLVGLVACRFALSELVSDVLDAYVGRNAGSRVLRGEMRRGQGHRLRAALLFADLRAFTSVAEAEGEGIVARLGLHLAAMAEPIEATGGEVLKFLGDGLLAAFPVEGDDPNAACAAALSAGREALHRTRLVNAAYPHKTPLHLDIALHLGEVFYGNIGAGTRLDFTVIGAAVNEASRLEGLCGVLDRPLLMSAPFANCCGSPTVSLGHHDLRGIAEPREVFTVP